MAQISKWKYIHVFLYMCMYACICVLYSCTCVCIHVHVFCIHVHMLSFTCFMTILSLSWDFPDNHTNPYGNTRSPYYHWLIVWQPILFSRSWKESVEPPYLSTLDTVVVNDGVCWKCSLPIHWPMWCLLLLRPQEGHRYPNTTLKASKCATFSEIIFT